MVKKVIIAGVFIGGGIYLLKKLLPMFKTESSEFDLETKEYDVKEYIPPKVTYTVGLVIQILGKDPMIEDLVVLLAKVNQQKSFYT